MNKKTLKKSWESFERKWDKYIKDTYNHKRRDWKDYMILPIVNELKKLGYKTTNNELQQFGLRSHVPVTFYNDNECFYIDFSHNSDWLNITNFAKQDESYPTNSIGQINGFNFEQFTFDGTKTVNDIVEFIIQNKNESNFKTSLEGLLK